MDLHTAGHRRGVVAAPHHAAAESGRAILAEGGNALEAMAHSPQRELVATNSAAGDMIEVAVSDTGHGFAADVQPNLFQTFFTTKESGMGVGLSISRTIVEAHGGRMWAETNRSGGATFRFTLPVAGQA